MKTFSPVEVEVIYFATQDVITISDNQADVIKSWNDANWN